MCIFQVQTQENVHVPQVFIVAELRDTCVYTAHAILLTIQM